jgi:putative copper resistance protein D
LTRIGAAAALLLGVAWFIVVTMSIADVQDPIALASALLVVATHTQFGHWMGLRLLLLIGPLLLTQGRLPLALISGAALAIQPRLGHAGAMMGRVGLTLSATESVHLLAAGAWFGGLLPLWLVLRSLPAAVVAKVCERFSHLGQVSVAVIAVTGIAAAWIMVDSFQALLGTLYGRLLLVKLTLFALALILACLNRFLFTPMLRQGSEPPVHSPLDPTRAPAHLTNTQHVRRGLIRSVGAESILVAGIVATAGVLASAPPPMHHHTSTGMEHEHQH